MGHETRLFVKRLHIREDACQSNVCSERCDARSHKDGVLVHLVHRHYTFGSESTRNKELPHEGASLGQRSTEVEQSVHHCLIHEIACDLKEHFHGNRLEMCC